MKPATSRVRIPLQDVVACHWCGRGIWSEDALFCDGCAQAVCNRCAATWPRDRCTVCSTKKEP